MDSYGGVLDPKHSLNFGTVTSAKQIGSGVSGDFMGHSANTYKDLDYQYELYDKRGVLPAWMDFMTGYDRDLAHKHYEQWLADTAIRRRMADAKAAGVNPLYALIGNSGASVGSGMPSSGNSASNRSGANDVIGAILKLVGTLAFLAKFG